MLKEENVSEIDIDEKIHINEKINYIIEQNLIDMCIQDEEKEFIKESFLRKIEENLYEINFENSEINDVDTVLTSAIKICLNNEKIYLKKLEQYKNFKKNYNQKVYIAIIFGIVLPLICTGFVFELEYKLIILLYIICSIIISSMYIIILEYINHSLKLELEIRE